MSAPARVQGEDAVTGSLQHGKRCLVLANPVAGAFTDELVAGVVGQCEAHGAVVATHLTSRPGHAAQIVAEAVAADGRELGVVVVVGGDGTVREAAEGLARALGRWPSGRPAHPRAAETRPPALFVVPAGTCNSSYRAIWGEPAWPDVLASVLAGDDAFFQVRELDLARLVEHDRAVLLGASTGLIAEITEAALDFPQVAGWERYCRALAMVLADPRSYPGRVLVNGDEVHAGSTMMVTVGGAQQRVGRFRLLPRSLLDDGLLDVCVIDGDLDNTTRTELAPLVMTGDHLGHLAVAYVQGSRVVIERTDGGPLRTEHDGEMVPPLSRVTLEVVPGALPVVGPAPVVAAAG
jgi:diacylglycerol kinase (ATP)